MKRIITIFLLTFISLNLVFGNFSALAQETLTPDSLVEIADEHNHEFEDIHENKDDLVQVFEKSFDKSTAAFLFYGIDFSKNEVFLQVLNSEDKELYYLEVHQDDELSGEETSTRSLRSQLFYFGEGVQSVKLFSKNYIEGIQVKVVQSKSDSSFSPQAVSYIGQKHKDYYQNLGVNLKVREEWGVPRITEWQLSGGGTMAPWQAHDISSIVIHHTATSPNTSDPAAAVRAIYNAHKDNCANGGVLGVNCSQVHETWQDIGYNFVIDQNGTVYEGRSGGDGVVGAHSPPNYGALGIAIIGNYSSTMPNDATKNALKNLLVQLGALHNLNLKWGTNVYGHRDRNGTECPGSELYSYLPAILNEAKSQFPISSKNTELTTLRSQLVVGRSDFMKFGELVNMMINVNSISSTEKDFLEQNLYTASSFKIINGYYIFSVDDDYVGKVLKDTKAFFPNAQIQPVYVKNQSAVWTNSSGRATTDNYNTSTHWNLEKIKQPEAWSYLDGCQGDNLCGGDPAVIVAVIDTGVAYEKYNYDAGSYDDEADTDGNGTPNSIVNIGGLNIEVPNSDVQNNIYNEGYDRQYDVSEELENVNFVSPYDVVQDFLCDWRSGSAYTCNAEEITKIDHANDDDGHGTFVTTIIAGDALGPRTIGDASESDLIGIAHNVSIMPIKAFFPNDSSMCYTPGGDYDADCSTPNENLKGATFTFLLTESINYAVANGADIINMSLGGGGSDPALQAAINNAYNAGVTVVAASGNSGGNVNNFYPAAYDNVISVGASTSTDQRASYSNYGSKLDIVAPVGNGIPSEWYECSSEVDSNAGACFRETPYEVVDYPTDDITPNANARFRFTSSNQSPTMDVVAGTSFAAPQASAAAALLKSKYPSITPLEIENTLKSTATDILTAGKDDQSGYGVLNVRRALEENWTAIYSKPIYRFFNSATGTHFYTPSESEKNKIVSQPGFDSYELEGISMYGNASDSVGAKPVYRFFNTSNGTHFYTVSESEKAKLQTNPTFSQYIYEGVSYYANNGTLSGTRPVYRFFRTTSGTHFYTVSGGERDKLLNDLFYSDYQYEGISFYVYKTKPDLL